MISQYRLRIVLLLCLIAAIQGGACSKKDDDTDINELKLDVNELTLTVGASATLSIIESPSNASTVVWSSNNETVAEVFFGKVTALSGGKATIYVQIGEYSDSCIITVPEREYQLAWAEEFEGDALNMDHWNIEINGNGGGNNEEQYYTDRVENLRVADGLLTIEARKENYLGKSYTSARITTKNKRDFKYGKVEIRLKVPKGTGTWPAFWMLGYGDWPAAGEIDIMEHVGYDPKTFHCALHTLNKNGMNGQNQHSYQTFEDDVADDFHIITMEWVENEIMGYDRIHIYVDGSETATFGETQQLIDSGDWPFNDNFFFILNLAIGGSWGGLQGVDDTMFDSPVLYQIDYIRVYQLN
ncbi:family 16 glycosylhydrolase [Geofilum sp. OHC36d9]|uniref:family 16 glycosylhydrolase n=1 Tax=Geofilum sp. OHC36d9 TaxID=3458413 RepID=UPI0040332203